jgi:CheY-like chemotaxis protein
MSLANDQAQPADSAGGVHRGGQPMRLVVVEPHEDSRVMYDEFFGWSGVQLTTARTGAEALRILGRQVPDAIITCLRLPDMDGFALCAALRAMPHTTRVPVVAVSTCLPDHCRAAGDPRIAMVLMKPCLPGLLLDSIRDLCREKCPA